MNVRSMLGALVLVLACGRGDRGGRAADSLPAALVPKGPDHLVLRVPRAGGEARVYMYPRLDTIVWRADAAPAPSHVLAFDEEAGALSYVDAKDSPARIDFRQGTAFQVAKTKPTGLSSWDGSNVYGIAADGFVERYGPSGPWRWRPRLPARAVFPQPDGSLMVLAQHGDSSVVWRLRPPQQKIIDSVVLSRVNRTLRTQVGDRLYLGSGRELTGVRTKTMQRTTSVQFDDDIETLAATPSGDRVFVVTKAGTDVSVVDRFQEAQSGKIPLGVHAADLRVDPLGRYLLAKREGSDSVIVIALATNAIVGSVRTDWRDDLPFVGPDGSLALAQGPDVVLVNGATLAETKRLKGGASDFWYPFRWTGFRPRDARLDKPVDFNDSSAARKPADSAATRTDTAAGPPTVSVPPRDTQPRAQRPPSGFTVSFAALLVADKARELAAQIRVGNENARVVSAVRDGTPIFRVVLGPYPTKEEAERVGRDSHQSFWVYEGGP